MDIINRYKYESSIRAYQHVTELRSHSRADMALEFLIGAARSKELNADQMAEMAGAISDAISDAEE